MAIGKTLNLFLNQTFYFIFMDYFNFKNNLLGKRIDIDGVFRFQCVDTAKATVKDVWGFPFRPVGYSGGAKDIMKSNSLVSDEFVNRIPNSPNGVPPKGAIIVFDSTFRNPSGHVGTVDSADKDFVWVLEQNGGSGNGDGLGANAIRLTKYGYTTFQQIRLGKFGVGSCLGWLVPKEVAKVEPPKPKEPVKPLAWMNPRGREEQERFSYINDLNALYNSWVEGKKCDPEVANALADRDNEIKNYKANQ